MCVLVIFLSFMMANLKGNDTSPIQIDGGQFRHANIAIRSQPTIIRTLTIAAHDGAAYDALDVDTDIRGCFATAGTDKMVKLWNVQGDGESGKRRVSFVAQGEVFSVVWSPCDPVMLAAAVSKAKLQIWDVGANFGA